MCGPTVLNSLPRTFWSPELSYLFILFILQHMQLVQITTIVLYEK